MDKNTITGLVIIAAIVIGFTIYNRPSKEELARQQREQDSIAQLQLNNVKQDLNEATASKHKENENTDLNTFFDSKSSNLTVLNDSLSSQLDSTNVSAINNTTDKEQIVSLENSKLKIDISSKGGQIHSAKIKDYSTFHGDSLYMTKGDGSFSLELMNKQGVKLDTKDLTFKPIQNKDGQTLIMRMSYSANKHIDFIYALDPDSYMLNFDIAVVGMQDVLSKESLELLNIKWQQNLRRQEKSEHNEQRYARLHYKFINGSVEELSESKNDETEAKEPVKWVSFKDQFFATTLISKSNDGFDTSTLSSKMLESQDYLKDYTASLYIKPSISRQDTILSQFTYFIGPLEYYMLRGYDDNITNNAQKLELDKLIPLGWSIFRVVNQYFVIPLFNMLENTGMAMGLVILLLTIIVKLIISPLTYKSFMSSAKMRVLRPQVEELNEKYPGQENAMERQKAVMSLYSQAGANPMSGCIPMLLQMPILLALFSFFPSAIELRHKSFLWATDLSTYDAIFEWNTNIPLVSSWLGNHISLFCILMTVTNIIYTKFNMDATNTGQQQMPGMKWMMLLMPLVFFFVLNNYPSGLTYYYFLSTLMTILITLAFRYMVDEEKLLARLENNKKKPKKKGFMARLQEQAEQAQKVQQQQAKSKNNNKSKNSNKKK